MFFLRFCLLSGIVLSFAPLFAFIDGRASAFQACALQLAAGNAALALILLAFRYRVWAMAGLIAAFWNMALVWPAIAHPKAPPAAQSLKVVSLDLWYENPDPKKAAAWLLKSGADVIGLSEVTPESKAALAAMKSVYPYSVDCIGQDRFCELILLSKKPIRYAFAGKVGAKLTYVASADIQWQGRDISVSVTHIIVPFVKPDWPPILAWVPVGDPAPLLAGAPPLWQSMQAAVLSEYVSTLKPDRIVMGDFNSVPWGELQATFRAAAGLENRGALTPSWPAWAPAPLRIPIDQVFVGGALGIRSLATGPNLGSDHLPIVAEIAVPH